MSPGVINLASRVGWWHIERKPSPSMSAFGNEQTSRHIRVMSVIPLKARPSSARMARPLGAKEKTFSSRAAEASRFLL